MVGEERDTEGSEPAHWQRVRGWQAESALADGIGSRLCEAAEATLRGSAGHAALEQSLAFPETQFMARTLNRWGREREAEVSGDSMLHYIAGVFCRLAD